MFSQPRVIRNIFVPRLTKKEAAIRIQDFFCKSDIPQRGKNTLYVTHLIFIVSKYSFRGIGGGKLATNKSLLSVNKQVKYDANSKLIRKIMRNSQYFILFITKLLIFKDYL